MRTMNLDTYFTIYNNYLKMEYLPKCKIQNFKSSRREYRRKLWVRQIFIRYISKAQAKKRHIDKLDFIKTNNNIKRSTLRKILLVELTKKVID